jgi:tetratricopeptide (TPR) repeat protein
MMTRRILIVLLVVLAGTGCKEQQQQGQWGAGQSGQKSVVAPPASVMNTEQIRQLETIAKANPNNAAAWTAWGNALMDAQRFADAIIAYQRSLELEPKNADVRVDMGTCYHALGQSEKALEEFGKAIKARPDHANAYRNSGVVSASMGRKAEAIKFLEKYLQMAPAGPDADQIRAELQNLKQGK